MSSPNPHNGCISWAGLAKHPPPFVDGERLTGLRGQGQRYEEAVQRWLAHKYRNRYFPSPWFIYTTQEFDEIRWCQPDGLLFHEKKGILFLIEIKLRHTAAAWYQLHELYPPVVEYVFPRDIWTLRFVEVVRWYDPATYFPGRHFLRRTPHATMAGETGVVIWNQ